VINLKLGTRGSRLALAQARAIQARLEAIHQSLRVEIVEIHTSGDRIQDVPLGPHLGQAFFTKEIEDALLEEHVDLAVHSCKDLGATLPAGLVLAAVPGREDPRDALVSSGARLEELPLGAKVGTSSPRRRHFLSSVRPDLQIVDMRGNVPTRVAAVDEGRFDAAILAVAGLRRLGLEGRITEVLGADVMLPAAGQGALAVEAREDDERARELVSALDDERARFEVTAERACLRRLGAGCQAPVGTLARVRGEQLRLRAALATPEGIESVELSSTRDGAEALGVEAAAVLLERLGVATLREASWTGGALVGKEERP
jgi:hydroxymethylbilane synthase